MSPTVFRQAGFRFYFFSREESRMHIHAHGHSGEAKFWIEPQVELAQNQGLSRGEISLIRRLIEERENDIRNEWNRHFGR